MEILLTIPSVSSNLQTKWQSKIYLFIIRATLLIQNYFLLILLHLLSQYLNKNSLKFKKKSFSTYGLDKLYYGLGSRKIFDRRSRPREQIAQS